jgi:hypothetical protein
MRKCQASNLSDVSISSPLPKLHLDPTFVKCLNSRYLMSMECRDKVTSTCTSLYAPRSTPSRTAPTQRGRQVCRQVERLSFIALETWGRVNRRARFEV